MSSPARGNTALANSAFPTHAEDPERISQPPEALLDALVGSNKGKDTEFYQSLTEQVLFAFYPRECEECGIMMTGKIMTRPYVVRCTGCFKQKSRLVRTPLHCMRLPMWMFGWVMHESFKRYPAVLTSMEIHRRLDITYKSALLLKRRFQLFCVEQEGALRDLFKRELRANHYELPPSRKSDLTPVLAGQSPPVNIDTVAVFSASQRVAKGRGRYKHGGQTASIYLNDSLGGRQVGSLYQTIAVKGGPAFLRSVPDQKMTTLAPVVQEHILQRTPVFTDEGYSWLSTPNHRTINHSARARDRKRYKWAKNRWSKNGIHIQAAEGTHSAFKTAVRTYRYFRPENSQLYASEFTFLRNAAYYGLYKISNVLKYPEKTESDEVCLNRLLS